MLKVDYDYYTNVGGREINQDSVIATKQNNGYLFMVADGLGGYRGGEVASRLVSEVLTKHFTHTRFTFNPKNATEEANKLIIGKQVDDLKDMKSTIALIWLNDVFVECLHVGDTRVYLFKNGEIVYQSVDHSASQLAVFANEITREEIRRHCDRNVLTRVLGSDENIKSDVIRFDIKDIDAGLICSDGFWEYVLEDEMKKLLKESENIHDWLWEMRKIHKSRVRKKHDNNTAVVFKVGGSCDEIL